MPQWHLSAAGQYRESPAHSVPSLCPRTSAYQQSTSAIMQANALM